MNIFRSRAAGALAAAAALSLTATPAMARGWGHWHHHDGVDAGDVFAGLLVLGGVAAIAAAAGNSHKERQARDDGHDRDYSNDDYREAPPQPEYHDRGYGDGGHRDYREGPSNYGRQGISVNGAVDACVGEVQRGDRNIDSVDSVNREGDGWRVQGRVRDGGEFACSVDPDGRVREVSGL